MTKSKKIEQIKKEFKKNFITSVDWGFEFDIDKFGNWIEHHLIKEYERGIGDVLKIALGLMKTTKQSSFDYGEGYNHAVRDIIDEVNSKKK